MPTKPIPDDEVSPKSNQIFDAADMQRRYERLKREGRLPSLADVLRIIKESEEPKE